MEQPTPSNPPRILLVEDDTISQTYFRAVLEALPATVDSATTGASALVTGSAQRHDLWLIDLSLPDSSGTELLRRLRDRWPQPPPALAHTADTDASLRELVLQAGFRDLLIKPLSATDLTHAVHDALFEAGGLPNWDHRAAAAALNQDPANVQALRKLFLAELADARRDVLDSVSRGDEAMLRARLHRLQASCALVGAKRLGAAVEHLWRTPASRAALEDFVHAARDLLH